MILKILFIQRKEDYPEEYAPEALVCVDEYADEENPKWFEEECEKLLKEVKNNIVSSRVVNIAVSEEMIRKILLEHPTIEGKIVL